MADSELASTRRTLRVVQYALLVQATAIIALSVALVVGGR